MAEAMMEVWKNPRNAAARAEALHELVIAQFGWKTWAAKIAALARKAITPSEAG
jgi:hypothetical protein